MTDNALIVAPENGVDAYRMSTNAATLCGDIVRATAVKIQGKRYVCVEGWQAIAVAHGCVLSARDVQKIDGGWSAVGELRRITDGVVIATAEGFVGEDEKVWQNRPVYTKRALAQTRAMSRAGRSAFAFTVVLIDKDLGTTPAEEMHGIPIDNDGPGSSWGAGGKASAVDEAERDGLTKDAPKVSAAKRAAFETWTKNAIGTLKLSGQTSDSLKALFESPEWTKKLDTLDEYAPDLYGNVLDTYEEAQRNARAVAA